MDILTPSRGKWCTAIACQDKKVLFPRLKTPYLYHQANYIKTWGKSFGEKNQKSIPEHIKGVETATAKCKNVMNIIIGSS